MGHTASNILVHIIFSTKSRSPLITDDIADDLRAYMGGIIREMDGRALAINGVSDHVHLLVRVPAARSIAEVMRVVKANSSKWVHEKWPERKTFAWQSGYGAFSVSESNLGAVQRYIARQEQHHQKQSFQEEFLQFLKKNNVAYDERYIWT